MKKFILFLALLLSTKSIGQTSFAIANANILDSGIINAHYTINGNHFAFIFNDSSQQNTFLYSFQLCAESNPCSINIFTDTLSPHSGLSVFWISHDNVIFTKPGVYKLTARTTIIGNNTNIVSTGNSVAKIIKP